MGHQKRFVREAMTQTPTSTSRLLVFFHSDATPRIVMAESSLEPSHGAQLVSGSFCLWALASRDTIRDTEISPVLPM